MDHFRGDINSPVKSNFKIHPGKKLSRALPVVKFFITMCFLNFIVKTCTRNLLS